MELFLLLRRIKNIKALFTNFIKMYTEKRYNSRFGFVIFLMVVVAFVLFGFIFMQIFAESEKGYFSGIFFTLLVEAALFVDAYRLKGLKTKMPMSKKEMQMLDSIAFEKGLDRTTMKKYDNIVKNEESKPQVKKDSLDDLPSFDEVMGFDNDFKENGKNGEVSD